MPQFHRRLLSVLSPIGNHYRIYAPQYDLLYHYR
ncbi:hypothetical protein [uncultured Veillonella sp.]